MCHRRNTVLIPNGKKHLHFVVTDPVNGEILLVGITSSLLDPKFVLKRGDHTFIDYISYINYKQAFIAKADVVKRCLENKIWGKEPDAREKTIKKICKGILESDHTPEGVKNFFKSYEKNQLEKTG